VDNKYLLVPTIHCEFQFVAITSIFVNPKQTSPI